MIKEMVKEDTSQVVQLLKTLYGGEDNFIYEMLEQDSKKGVRYFVASENGVVGGVISFGIEGIVCKVHSHVVDKNRRTNGIGVDLLNYAEKIASESCSVAEATTYEEHYMDFLMKRGYKPALLQSGFVLMRKRLS